MKEKLEVGFVPWEDSKSTATFQEHDECLLMRVRCLARVEMLKAQEEERRRATDDFGSN